MSYRPHFRLGKTGDSRTRKKQVVERDSDKKLAEREQLKQAGSFAQYLIEKNFSNTTIKRYLKDGNRFLHWMEQENIELQTVRYADVLSFIQSLQGHTKKITASSYINSIRHYFNFLALTGHITENPTRHIQIRGIKRKMLYDILSRQELDSLYQNFEIPKEDDPNKNQNWFQKSVLSAKRNRIILGLVISQGLTTHEVGQLTLQDVKLREGKIYIAGSRRSEEREIKLESYQILDLIEYIQIIRETIITLTKKKSDRLFITIGNGDEAIHNAMFYLVSNLHKQNPKVKDIRQLRVSVITHWLKFHNLRQVQYLAGHRYVSSTENYLANDFDELADDISKYHPII